PPHHSITSSARASRVEGTLTPSALAASRLIVSSNLVGCRNGKIGCFRALENTADIDARLVVLIERTGAVAHQAAARREFAPAVDCGDGMARGESSESCASIREQRVI